MTVYTGPSFFMFQYVLTVQKLDLLRFYVLHTFFGYSVQDVGLPETMRTAHIVRLPY